MKRLLLAAVLGSTTLLATSTLAPAAHAAAAPTVARTVSDPAITESSGLTPSHRFGEVLYTHNDSGDGPRVFAIGSDGRTRAVLTLSGAGANDWEDIAAGPGTTLWVADIGDNARTRTEIQVYKISEPSSLVSQSVPWTRYRFAYPDGAHDAEGLLVNPSTGVVSVISKAASGAAVYQAPSTLSTTSVNRLTKVATAPSTITGADYSWSGRRLVMRNYTTAFVYSGIGATPRTLTLPSQRQGESVTFGPADSLLIGSEGSGSTIIKVPLS